MIKIGSKWKCECKNHLWFEYGEIIEVEGIVEGDGYRFIAIKDSIFKLLDFRLKALFKEVQMKIYEVGFVDNWRSSAIAYFSTIDKAKKFKKDNALRYREELHIVEVEVDKHCK